jgi:hypothetical protein
MIAPKAAKISRGDRVAGGDVTAFLDGRPGVGAYG